MLRKSTAIPSNAVGSPHDPASLPHWYSAATDRKPICRPDGGLGESSAFVHGRDETLPFDRVLRRRPTSSIRAISICPGARRFCVTPEVVGRFAPAGGSSAVRSGGVFMGAGQLSSGRTGADARRSGGGVCGWYPAALTAPRALGACGGTGHSSPDSHAVPRAGPRWSGAGPEALDRLTSRPGPAQASLQRLGKGIRAKRVSGAGVSVQQFAELRGIRLADECPPSGTRPSSGRSITRASPSPAR